MDRNPSFPLPVDVKMTVRELVENIGDCFAMGDTSIEVKSVSSPSDAADGSIVFFDNCGASLKHLISVTNASVYVISEVPQGFKSRGKCIIVTNEPRMWYVRALYYLLNLETKNLPGGSIKASVDDDVIVGSNVSIGLGAVIEAGCVIGDDSVIGANTFIASNTYIAEGVLIQNNVSIGSVGLGYFNNAKGQRVFFPHLGSVYIGQSAVVGSGSVIVRGQLSDTVIGASVRLGNLVNVGHNVHIGSNSVLSSNVCIAGGVSIGAHCNFGVGSSVAPKLNIGNGCKIGIGSVVIKNIPDHSSYFGNPARPLPTMRGF